MEATLTQRPGPPLKSDGLPGLLDAMQSKGLDDETLGARMGKAARTIQSWRLGNASPKLPDLLRLSQELGVSVGKLTGQNSEP